VYPYLSSEDIDEAESAILLEFDVHQSFDRLRIDTSPAPTTGSFSSSSSTNQSLPTKSTLNQRSSLNDFFRMCDMPIPSKSAAASVQKQLSFKEEICHYMGSVRSASNFSEYWCQQRALLPLLVQFVERYNCIPITSVPSESAFSIAGHI
jgi:hypothetical protein